MSPSRSAWIAGNWKMHGTLADNAALVSALLAGNFGGNVENEVVLCVPFPYLEQVSRLLAGKRLCLGAQDVSAHIAGAFTGEVSATMLIDFGCRYVLVGHSERRRLHGETNETVAAKFDAAAKAGLRPVLCLGETLEERKAGRTREVVIQQLEAVLTASGVSSLKNAVLAYEPVWAIGTGQVATPEEAEEVHYLLRERVALEDAAVAATLRIVYGGSVTAKTAPSLFAMPDVDGGLVGGASLKAEEFLAICQAASF